MYNLDVNTVKAKKDIMEVSNLYFGTTDSDFETAFKKKLTKKISVQNIADTMKLNNEGDWESKSLDFLISKQFTDNIITLLDLSPKDIMKQKDGNAQDSTLLNIEQTLN